MNLFQKQLLLKDDKSMAELDNPERNGIGQPLPQQRVSVSEFKGIEGYDRVERIAEVQQFFETDWEHAKQLTDFFDG